ncbi:hypothetical protein F9C07_7476 [Aspergillus flavus]|uniref:Uncharacterized protein n=1 Tax=Aspergillus flavus (strain ATCC 200026 / FGSC A1120 / IAM 13836 / NRRL 3357 / JCM 12722 / SRRC 167) TaxID=332952 RepID=A0A7U2MMV0_ASPFN|nr:hypothetical protein F9C07_7476 [Aspergillus flavus]
MEPKYGYGSCRNFVPSSNRWKDLGGCINQAVDSEHEQLIILPTAITGKEL